MARFIFKLNNKKKRQQKTRPIKKPKNLQKFKKKF